MKNQIRSRRNRNAQGGVSQERTQPEITSRVCPVLNVDTIRAEPEEPWWINQLMEQDRVTSIQQLALLRVLDSNRTRFGLTARPLAYCAQLFGVSISSEEVAALLQPFAVGPSPVLFAKNGAWRIVGGNGGSVKTN